MPNENLGPAEHIIQTVLAFTDHMFHNRPGMVVPDRAARIGVKWLPVTHKIVDGKTVVYELRKVGKGSTRIELGSMPSVTMDAEIRNGAGVLVGRYRPSGFYPEVVAWLYKQIAEIWKMDNEFAARWASFEFSKDHRDLKVLLAAFMMVQSRKGDPIMDQGEVQFFDENYRDIGEAMALAYKEGERGLDAKLLLRVHDVLVMDSIASINRELGFGKSLRKPTLGRWKLVTDKWLRFREENPKLLQGLVKSGFRITVCRLAQLINYKPTSPYFFKALRWKQQQSKQGHRALAIGDALTAAETWAGFSEEEICKKIMAEKPNFKRLISLIPNGFTRAIMAAAVEAGCFSSKELIIYTPTLEDLGLMQVQEVRERWEKANKEADDMRSANIASRVRSKVTQEALQATADNAVKKAVEEVIRGVYVYFMVDVSSSMEGALPAAKTYIARFLQGFPQDKIKIAVFNTQGREVRIPHASAAGVENAFRGILASGGTDYGAPIRVLQQYKPGPGEDALFIFVGDEGHNGTMGGHGGGHFSQAVTASGLNPVAFGLVPVVSPQYGRARSVRDTATQLGIPCFEIDEATFADPYAIPRTVRALIAATPVQTRNVAAAAPRLTLVDQILKTDLLKKPAWAAA